MTDTRLKAAEQEMMLEKAKGQIRNLQRKRQLLFDQGRRTKLLDWAISKVQRRINARVEQAV